MSRTRKGNFRQVVLGLLLTLAWLLPGTSLAQFTYTTNAGGTNLTITGYTGPGGVVTIPLTINGLPVTAIGSSSFLNNTSLTSVTIPNGVVSIGSLAFRSCTNLMNATIPSSVTSIGSYVFLGCASLTNITVDAANPNYSSDVTGVLFNKTQTTLIQYPGGKSGNYTIPNVVGSIEDSAFRFCYNLTSVMIPNSVTNIRSEAFASCTGLTSVTIPGSVTSIQNSAFTSCTSLTNVTIGNGVARIGTQAFLRCTGLTSVTIGNAVTNIGYGGFDSCISLPSVVIPASVTSIESRAFSSCASLTNITVDAANPNYSSDVTGVLFNKTQTTLIQYPEGKAGSYIIPASVSSIESRAFASCTNLTSATIPNSVTNIGSEAFVSCTGLKSVTIPNSVINIGSDALAYCAGLTNLSIGSGLTSIGSRAFSPCASLTNITVDAVNPNYSSDVNGVLFNKTQTTLIQCPGGKAGGYIIPSIVTSIGINAFYICTNLTSVTIPNSVTSIGNSAFYFCRNLTNVTIPNSVTSIGNSAFNNCSSLTSVTIPSSVTSIGNSAFSSCASLTNITVHAANPNYSSDVAGVLFNKTKTTLIQYPGSKAGPYTISDNVTSIGARAFRFCYNLTSVMIPNSVTNIESEAFFYCTGLTNVYFKGNAPFVGSSLFLDPISPTVYYYLPGTTGWGTTFGGRPAVLWNPLIQTGDANFGHHSLGFRLPITGTPNIPIVIEAANDPTGSTWTPLQSCTLTNGLIYFSDAQWTNFQSRIYRIRSP
jgi:hypothetical protein